MNVVGDLCQLGFELFHIEGEIIKIFSFYDYIDFDKKPSEVKVIAKIEFMDRKPLVIRVTKEKHIGNELAENQSVFSQELIAIAFALK